MGSVVSFEVMIYKEGHWTIAFITDSKEEALAEAKNAESGKHAQAVKVVQETTDEETGDEKSKTIYSGGIKDGIPDTQGAKILYQRKAGQKNKAVDDPTGKDAKQKLHPELVTDFIDRIRLSVIVFGSVAIALVVLMFLYISNPEAVSGFIDGLLK